MDDSQICAKTLLIYNFVNEYIFDIHFIDIDLANDLFKILKRSKFI